MNGNRFKKAALRDMPLRKSRMARVLVLFINNTKGLDTFKKRREDEIQSLFARLAFVTGGNA